MQYILGYILCAMTLFLYACREAHLRFGGPDGGSGGVGGSVVVVADRMTRTLAPLRKLYTAGAGGNGRGANCQGRNGESVLIKVYSKGHWVELGQWGMLFTCGCFCSGSYRNGCHGYRDRVCSG